MVTLNTWTKIDVSYLSFTKGWMLMNNKIFFLKYRAYSLLFAIWLCISFISVPCFGATSESLNTTKTDWWLVRAKNHEIPRFNTKLNYKLEDFGGYCLGDTSRKVIYLTFDEGYENGYTSKILDILKVHDVKAMFFVTLPYLEKNQDLIKRMDDEGHLVCNHTNHHLSMPTLVNNEEKFNTEIISVAEAYQKITGSNMPGFFRPPMGHYSQKSLAMTKALGYRTIFWSFAYCDWKSEAQPEPNKAKQLMLDGLHNGAIYLLHAVSKTNTEILGDFINEAENMGYTFELLPSDNPQ